MTKSHEQLLVHGKSELLFSWTNATAVVNCVHRSVRFVKQECEIIIK